MIKIVHIHTDIKFIDDSNAFFYEGFENLILIIGEDSGYVGDLKESIIYFPNNKKSRLNIIEICNKYDIVVLYDLDFIKATIALKLSQNIKIIWRFFGYELYGRNISKYLSEYSKKHHRYSYHSLLREFFGAIKFFIVHIKTQSGFYFKAISRINILIGLSKFEYEDLIKDWGKLPSFLQRPVLFPVVNDRLIFVKKTNSILIGHSKTIFNNHLDIIEIIENIPFKCEARFIIPFSYGVENDYTLKVRDLVSCSKFNFEFLEEYLPLDQYYTIISEAKCAVFNGYRQLAMGNITVLLSYGTKIYLNTKNVIYHWFLELGLIVFSIEDFKKDLLIDNLELTFEEKVYNKNKINEVNDIYSQNRFIDELRQLIK